MSAIKKAFAPLIALLEANRDVKVKSILDQAIELASAKRAGGVVRTVLRNAAGDVAYIFCYYHKVWLPVTEFGVKKGSTSGFSNMSREGTSNWTRQQNEYKKTRGELLDKVASGEIAGEELGALLEQCEANRNVIVEHSTGGYASEHDIPGYNAETHSVE